jgi:hypothetical protein
MEQVIKGLKYDTERSILIASSKDGAKHLYKTKNGRFFLYFEHPAQSTVAPYLEAISPSRAKKEYGTMPRQFVSWDKAFGEKIEEA